MSKQMHDEITAERQTRVPDDLPSQRLDVSGWVRMQVGKMRGGDPSAAYFDFTDGLIFTFSNLEHRSAVTVKPFKGWRDDRVQRQSISSCANGHPARVEMDRVSGGRQNAHRSSADPASRRLGCGARDRQCYETAA
jgi:hypothetical protein